MQIASKMFAFLTAENTTIQVIIIIIFNEQAFTNIEYTHLKRYPASSFASMIDLSQTSGTYAMD